MHTDTLATVDTGTVRGLHRDLIRIRLIDERIAALYPEQEMRCPVHVSIGQEAGSVGGCANRGRAGGVLRGQRSHGDDRPHGHYPAKAGSLTAMFAGLSGRATGCTSGKGGSMHLLDLEAGFFGAVPIVGSTIPIAVGAAWASRMRGEDRVLVAFFCE